MVRMFGKVLQLRGRCFTKGIIGNWVTGRKFDMARQLGAERVLFSDFDPTIDALGHEGHDGKSFLE